MPANPTNWNRTKSAASSFVGVDGLATYLSPDSDVVIILIDFEGQYSSLTSPTGRSAKPSIPTQIGIVKLDTQQLQNSEQSPMHMDVKLYCPRGCKSGPRSSRRPDRTLTRGSYHRIYRSEVAQTIEQELTPLDPATGEPRKVILMGHGFSRDLLWMQHMCVDVETMPHIKACTDTFHLGGQILGANYSLRNLLWQLGIPYVRPDHTWSNLLHNAGNDAYFTTKALLALAAKHFRVTSETFGSAALVERMVKTATAPLPPRAVPRLSTPRQSEEAQDKGPRMTWDEMCENVGDGSLLAGVPREEEESEEA